jgi:hypothetical protein
LPSEPSFEGEGALVHDGDVELPDGGGRFAEASARAEGEIVECAEDGVLVVGVGVQLADGLAGDAVDHFEREGVAAPFGAWGNLPAQQGLVVFATAELQGEVAEQGRVGWLLHHGQGGVDLGGAHRLDVGRLRDAQFERGLEGVVEGRVAGEVEEVGYDDLAELLGLGVAMDDVGDGRGGEDEDGERGPDGPAGQQRPGSGHKSGKRRKLRRGFADDDARGLAHLLDLEVFERCEVGGRDGLQAEVGWGS